MKVIFLDIDGVLNNSTLYAKFVHANSKDDDIVDVVMVARLNTILAATGAKCVLSSSWRYSYTAQQMQQFLTKFGFDGEIIDVTGIDPSGVRGLEIQAWLDQHPEVKSFAIIDDDADMANLSKYLIQTSFDTGLLDNHVQQAIDLFKSQEA